jgi:class 3 adenylate cyclase
MPACRICGQENPAEARFCFACGSALAADERSGDERRDVSIIFVDLVGFTARADRLDPEDVRALLTPYHERVRREIQSFGGVVEKFIGDAVMGVFGAPIAYGDDAERAVRAALVVRDSVDEIGGGDLSIRIAVNTGEAVVSLNARPALGESMVAGDVVNTASRLQSAAPANGIVVGEETYRATRNVIEYAQSEPVVAKGKEAPVPAWIAVRAIAEAGERPASGARFVGRTRELDVLRALWGRVADDRQPHLVTFVGPTGVGKSTLSTTFLRELDGAHVAIGRCLPYRESSPYGALSSQVLQLCDVYESDRPDVVLQKLEARAAPMLGPDAAEVARHVAMLVGIDTGDAATGREQLFRSARRFFQTIADERPTVLVFEDLHWGEASLLDLVDGLAAQVRDVPLLLMALSRPELLDSRPDWGSGIPDSSTLTLLPLGEAEARELASLHLRHEERLAEVTRLAEGNPLFIEQLAATIGEQAHGALPTTVRGIVAARLDALPAAERALILDAAVGGKVFWSGALRAMNPELTNLVPLLDSLERRDLIRREPTSMMEGQDQFTFKHMLIRDVAYEMLPRAERVRRHAEIATFFEGLTGASGEASGAIARHWREAGQNARAVERLVHAADQAERGWAKDHAVVLYQEAIELLDPDDEDQRRQLRRRLALASQALYHVPDVRRPGSRQA